MVLDALSLSLLWYLLFKSPWDLKSVFDSAVQWGSQWSNWHHRFCTVVWESQLFFHSPHFTLAALYRCLIFGDKLEISENNEMRWSLRSCPILCDPMDYSLPDFSVHGILQARIWHRVFTHIWNIWKQRITVEYSGVSE